SATCQASLSMGLSKQEYWSGLLCPPLEDLPNLGIEPTSLTFPSLAGGFFTTRATGEAQCIRWNGTHSLPFTFHLSELSYLVTPTCKESWVIWSSPNITYFGKNCQETMKFHNEKKPKFPISSAHEILQAGILEWATISFSKYRKPCKTNCTVYCFSLKLPGSGNTCKSMADSCQWVSAFVCFEWSNIHWAQVSSAPRTSPRVPDICLLLESAEASFLPSPFPCWMLISHRFCNFSPWSPPIQILRFLTRPGLGDSCLSPDKKCRDSPKIMFIESVIAALNMPANLKNSAAATELEKVSFYPIPKKGIAKECSNYCTIALISHTCKIMLKILQARLQQYANCELTDIKLPTSTGSSKKQESSRKTSISALLTMPKPLTTLESPLDCKEIQAVHPKGDQLSKFINPYTHSPCSIIEFVRVCLVGENGPHSCDPHTTQRRTRHLLRPSVSSRTCAEDSQVRPCLLNENCFQFQYNLTEWSTCQLSENATCGQGFRTRLLSCVRSDGKPVAMDECEQVSQRSRTRFILMPTQGEGRPCPTELTQHKTCPMTPCYSWVLSNWSACKLEGGDCGEGVQTRSLSCVVHNGSTSPWTVHVDNALCGEMPFQDSILKQPCSVPCPGDCHLTEWSAWSTCELTCIDGRSFETLGRQSRSRTFIIQSFENQDSCPQQVLETRPCTGGKCYHYTWKASLWNNNERTVWCQRSDGINVTGGCSPQARPAAIRQCNPACRKPFSYCTQGGVCGCEKGYTEIMRSNGLLDYCMKVPGSEDKKADVKTLAGKNRPVNSKIHDIFKGWSLQPLDPDGRVKIWVYGVSGGGFLIMIFLVFTSYLVCKKPKPHQSTPPQQKPLTLAYDGDLDM
ncbi:hypothetical protein FD754_008553, partial [Muntiacus muntjak]